LATGHCSLIYYLTVAPAKFLPMGFRFKSNNIIALIIAALLVVAGIVLGVIHKHSETEVRVTAELPAEGS